VKTSRTHKSPKNQALLISVAESIGSTLGAIAAKADAAQRAITGSDVVADVKRKTTKIVRKGNRAAARAKKSVKKSTPARAARRTIRKASKRVSGKRVGAKK
jgi:RNA processing factor Prp31